MELKTLKLGIIGLSEGNGHPYSWSAIVNGDFDMRYMKDCGYPTIPAYLSANRDTLGIDFAEVTHIWTQDRSISEHVSKASGVNTVVDKDGGPRVPRRAGRAPSPLYAGFRGRALALRATRSHRLL